MFLLHKVRRLFSILLVSAILLLLAACGGNSSNYIGKDAAKEIALEDAGFPEKYVIQMKVSLEREEQAVYKVFFINAEVQYYYTIDAVNGTILSASTESLF